MSKQKLLAVPLSCIFFHFFVPRRRVLVVTHILMMFIKFQTFFCCAFFFFFFATLPTQHTGWTFLRMCTLFLKEVHSLTLRDSPCVSTSRRAWILCTVARRPSSQSLVQLCSSSSPGDNAKQKFKPHRAANHRAPLTPRKSEAKRPKSGTASQVLLDLLVLA